MNGPKPAPIYFEGRDYQRDLMDCEDDFMLLSGGIKMLTFMFSSELVEPENKQAIFALHEILMEKYDAIYARLYSRGEA